jgi:hypothetical protein
VAALGGAAASWPLAARAQQVPMRRVGLLYSGSPESIAGRIAVFRKGLSESGYVEGRNVAIDTRKEAAAAYRCAVRLLRGEFIRAKRRRCDRAA